MKLDLGSGPIPRAGFVGVDLRPPAGGVAFDFDSAEPWPFETASVDELYSSHLIEHLHAGRFGGRDVLVRFFEEAWRVGKPGSTLYLRWPSLVDESTGAPLASYWYDPTHRRAIPRQQLLYFSLEGRRHLGVEFYDYRCNWVIERCGQGALTEDRTLLEYQALLRHHPL